MKNDSNNSKPGITNSSTAIEQFKHIKQVLESSSSSNKTKSNTVLNEAGDIPLLDEIIQTSNDSGEYADIPVLADLISQPNVELNLLATQSWQAYNSLLLQWSNDLPEPMRSLSQQFLTGFASKLESNWEALFNQLVREQSSDFVKEQKEQSIEQTTKNWHQLLKYLTNNDSSYK